jgi:phosphatidylserine/phosphatidylglycerophosphate/cardiolipin synthase-like enzyme
VPADLLEGAHSEKQRIQHHTGLHESVEWLVDNAVTYNALIGAVRRAQRSVSISQLAFDADCLAYSPDGAPTRLLDTLVEAHLGRGVEVRVLLNETLLLDTATPLRRALERMNASAIQVRGMRRFPQLLHAKMLIVDEREAYLIGSPFVNGYWDDSAHRPTDARRPARELGGRPLHDLSARVTGHAVDELSALFEEWWSSVAGTHAPKAIPPARESYGHDIMTGERIRVARTAPGSVLRRRPEGDAEILHAMLDGIARAVTLIYIEHQYLSSRAIIHALCAALARSPTLEVIALLNQNPDVTAYRVWQNTRLRESGLLEHPRVGLFALWSRADIGDGRIAVNQVFVHSKVIIVDDEWATMGSANVDGVSLHSYGDDFASRLGQRVFRHVRNFDVNLVIAGDGRARSAAIASLRTTLWSEHLGGWPAALADSPHGGWLAHWRQCAAENVALLNHSLAAAEHSSRSFVLPYSLSSRPLCQLDDVGVTRSAHLDVRFSPSWLEIHCSPNWIRNMFA